MIVHNSNDCEYLVGTIALQNRNIVFSDPRNYKIVSTLIDDNPIVLLNERTGYKSNH
jgi:hypothetical protein